MPSTPAPSEPSTGTPGRLPAFLIPRYPAHRDDASAADGRLDGFRTEFHAPIDWSGQSFPLGVNFACCVFHERVTARGTRFAGMARFWKCVFVKGADFSSCIVEPWKDRDPNAVYNGELNLSFSRFLGPADCFGAQFKGPALFWRSRFQQVANFRGVHFGAGVTFEDRPDSLCLDAAEVPAPGLWAALRQGGVLFPSAEASDVADLPPFRSIADIQAYGRQAGLHAAAVAWLCDVFQERSMPMFGGGASFVDASFAQPKASQFRNISLARCAFAGSNGGLARFHNVTWARADVFGPGERRALFDEISAQSTGERSAAGRIYHDLRMSHEARTLFDEASDFRYGEMEMRRLSGPRPVLSLIGMYRILSGYGESPGVALAWLCAFVFLIFPVLYYVAGFSADPLACIVRSLEAATFLDSPKDAMEAVRSETVRTLVRMLAALQRVTMPAQAAMFILAVQRKFGLK